MKKLLVATNIVFATIIYFQSCITTTSQQSRINNINETITSNYKHQPVNGISVALAKTMVANYKTNEWNNYHPTQRISGADVTVDNARSVWFNMDSLKKFMWHCERDAKASGLSSAELKKIGIRLYYGEYPPESTWADTYPQMTGMKKSFEKLHTVFMIPTYFDGTYNKEFDPTKFDATRRPVALNTLLKTKQISVVYAFAPIASSPTSNPNIQNHGDLIPPMNSGTVDYKGADFMQYSDGL